MSKIRPDQIQTPGDATKYLDGTGAFSTPAGGGGGGSLPADAAGWLHDNGSGTLAWTTPTASDVGAQPVDSDLTAIAALTTTTFGRSLLEAANAAGLRTLAGLGTAATSASTDFQPVDSDLTAIAALTTTSYGRSLLEAANAAALRTLAGLGSAATSASTDFQAADADLTTIAALDSATAGALVTDGAGWIRKTYAQLKTALSLVKSDVGLANVDNTADTAKPVSTAQQTALDLKANLASPTLTGTPAAPTAAQGTNTTQVATTAYVQTEVGLLIPKSLIDAKGDLFVGTADNTVARLAAGTNGYELVADSTQAGGLIWKPRTRSVSDTHANTSAVNTTAETVIATQAIPTAIAAGDVLHLTAVGDLLNASGASVNYTIKVIIGATTVLTTTAIAVGNVATNRHQWRLTADLLAAATNDERVSAELNIGPASASSWATGAGTVAQTTSRGTAAEDLTAGKDFKVSVTMSAASASADFICHESWLEISKR